MDVFMYWTSISLLFYWNGWSGVARWSRWVPWGPAGSGGGCHGDKGSSATQSAVAPASSPRPPILPFLLKQHIHLAPSQLNQLSNENPMRIQWESSKNLETIESLKPSLSLINLKMLYNDCIDGLICVEFNWRCANGKRRLICIICIFYISPPIIILNKNDDDDLIKHTQIIFLKSS